MSEDITQRNAQNCKKYYSRIKSANALPPGVVKKKTNSEMCRRYRQRKKLLAQQLQSKNEVVHTPSTSSLQMTLEPQLIATDTRNSTQDTTDVDSQHNPNRIVDWELGMEVTIISKNLARELLNETKADVKDTKISTVDKTKTTPPVSKTYINKNKIKRELDNSVIDNDKQIKVVEIKNINIELYKDIDIKNEIDVVTVENAIDNTILNVVDSKTDYTLGVQVYNDLNEFRIKEEADYEDGEPDFISWDDVNCGVPCTPYGFTSHQNFEDTKQVKKKKSIRNPALLAPKSLKDKYINKCTKCHQSFQTIRKYLYHFKSHNYKHLTCPECFKQFSWMQNLTSHVDYHIKKNFVMMHAIRNKKVHTKSNYQCRKCEKRLLIHEFFQHWESHLEIKDMATEVQEAAVNMEHKPLLKEMLAIIQGPDTSAPTNQDWKLRQCVICDKRFERRNDCKRHYIEHLLADAYIEKGNLGSLMCQICGLKFQKGDYYKRHMRDHASLPIYKCEICDKTFSDSSNFCKHKKVHNLSVLICDICKKKFNNKKCLIRHIRLHQIVKPIECDSCDKIFYTQSSYNKHLKSNRSRCKCLICSLYFTSLKDKWDHMWEVHKERKYEADCPLCNKSFRKFLDVKRHLRDHHNEKNYMYYKKKKHTKPNDNRESSKEDVIIT